MAGQVVNLAEVVPHCRHRLAGGEVLALEGALGRLLPAQHLLEPLDLFLDLGVGGEAGPFEYFLLEGGEFAGLGLGLEFLLGVKVAMQEEVVMEGEHAEWGRGYS